MRPRTAPNSAGASSTRIDSTRRADQTKAPAAIAKTAAGLVAASRSPPSAGPANRQTLSIALEAALAAVSCSGVATSAGRSAA
jgi:hypothetical protein